jgi:hypothetical protein
MKQDIRHSARYRQAESFYSQVQRPGGGRISDVAEMHVSPNGSRAVFTGVILETLKSTSVSHRCTPPGEAVQFQNAPRENGGASVLVVYPEAGQGVRKFPAAIEYAARVVGWFEDHITNRAIDATELA